MSKKINPKSVIASSQTSILIFLLSFIIFLLYVFFGFKNSSIEDFFSFLIIFLLVFIPSFLKFYKKEIYLTGNSIYIYLRGEKICNLTILGDLKALDIRQDKIGKFFKYGTLVMVTRNDEIYEYIFLSEPEKIQDAIMYRYEYLMKKNDPLFIPTYKKDKQQEKQLDSIEEINEK